MNRINEKFKSLNNLKKTAFMPFLVAGDPNFTMSLKIIKRLLPLADFLEIGVPYSDPLADGPVIQAADQRALKAGITTARVFRLIGAVRQVSQIPITVLAYANLVYRQGIDHFYRQAATAGVDGVLVPDLPVEESSPFVQAARRHGIAPIFLVSQTTTEARLQKILKYAQGYLYLVSVLGVTGARKSFDQKTLKFVKFVKRHSDLPAVVGFGISSSAQIAAVARAGADGAIVGSAIIKIIEQHLGDPSMIKKVEQFAAVLCGFSLPRNAASVK